MKLFSHFVVTGFSNSYLVGPERPGDALLVDPGSLDVNLLKMIENNGYYIRSVLVTHAHEAHIRGIKTLLKIYDAQIFSANYQIYEFPCTNVVDGEVIETAGFSVEVTGIPGHSNDSVVYRIENTLFTGDTLNAGGIGSTPNGYARALLVQNIREKLLSKNEDLVVLPGHGPPTMLEIERRFNPALRVKF